MAVSCAAALWRWNSIFLDRRDYASLVRLPVSLTRIFFANLFAIFAVTALLTIVVNAASFVLFPIAVVGSQGSFSPLFRFAFGHAISVILSSAFSFLAIFALSGDRKSTRLNSSHGYISYAVFCLKKKNTSLLQPHPSPLLTLCLTSIPSTRVTRRPSTPTD